MRRSFFLSTSTPALAPAADIAADTTVAANAAVADEECSELEDTDTGTEAEAEAEGKAPPFQAVPSGS